MSALHASLTEYQAKSLNPNTHSFTNPSPIMSLLKDHNNDAKYGITLFNNEGVVEQNFNFCG